MITLKRTKMRAGQNIRYTGKSFQGYIKKQPYMIFLEYQSENRILVSYNHTEISVYEFNTEPVV